MKQLFVHTLLFILFLYAFLFGYQTLTVHDPEHMNVKTVQQQNPPRTKSEIDNNPLIRFPDSVTQSKAIKDGEVIYNVEYETDHHLCRKSLTSNPNATKHALFSGCSFVYGTGINANETLSYFFQKKTNEYEEHNLGFPGGGIQQVLKHQELYKWQDMMEQKNGYFFYFFIHDQLNRFNSSLRYLAWSPKSAPVYYVKKDAIVSGGTVSDLEQYRMLNWAKKLFLSKLYINFYEKPTDDDESIQNFVVAVSEAKKRYIASYPNGEFIFVFHPMAMTGTHKDDFIRYLKEKSIRFLDAEKDFKKLLSETHEKESMYQIPGDIHPNAKLNEWLADYLIKEITVKPVVNMDPVTTGTSLNGGPEPLPDTAVISAPGQTPAAQTTTPTPAQ